MPKIVIRSNSDSEAVLHTLNAGTLWDHDLSGLNLANAAMYAVEIVGEKRSKSSIIEVRARHADLSGANFANANLSGAVFSDETIVQANFAGANLSNATFVRTHLIRVNLTRTNLSKARLSNTCFEGCDTLDQAKGLQLVKHLGPSTLDAVTLRSCVRNLPIQFLFGLGYTEEEIDVLKALYGTERSYYSCFISYARANDAFAERLRGGLLSAGISCWQDVHDMRGGATWRGQLYDAIAKHDKLVLVCSRASVKRPAVVEEILEAIQRERTTGTKKLFPIRLDEYVFSDELTRLARKKVANGEWKEDWVTYIRAFHIPDFSKWTRLQSFRAELRKLVVALTQPARAPKPATKDRDIGARR